MFFNPYQSYQDEPEEEKREILRPAAPSCYGCKYMVASPMLDCCHPTSIRVLWDPVRNRSYRIPSISICREQAGICKFYEPSSVCGAEYFIQKEVEDAEKKMGKGSIDDRVDNLMEELIGEGKLDKFMGKLSQKYMDYLTTDLDEEDEEEE